MGMILRPPRHAYASFNGRFIFLAGPIQGAEDWQSRAIQLLDTQDQHDVHIACPRRAGELKKLDARGRVEQYDWEHNFLEHAIRDGVILFWLANEAKHLCDRAYAQTSRFELGWAVGTLMGQGGKVVVGFDDRFSNAPYLRHTIGRFAPGIPLCSTLEETCEQALDLLAR